MSGTRISRYRLGARLGVGGTASVYMARLAGPHQFERLVALKLIHEHLLEESDFVNMFLDEAKLASRLSHPNIVHVYELGHDRETLFLAMEYLAGQPLSQLYTVLAQNGQRLAYDLLAWIGARAAEALHYAHESREEGAAKIGLVHRDVSPDNIFVTYEGHVKIIDFGIARAVGRLTTTALGTIKGKYRYMAPEQVLGRDYDHRVDLFALGATLYEVALGRPIFLGSDDSETLLRVLSGPAPLPDSMIAGFPEHLGRILMRSLAVDPEERYPSGAELGRDLDAFVATSGRVTQREALADVMREAFVAQREEAVRAVGRLRGMDQGDGNEEERLTLTGAGALPWWTRRVFWAPVLLCLAGAAAIVGSSHGAAERRTFRRAPSVDSLSIPALTAPPRVSADLPLRTVAIDNRDRLAGESLLPTLPPSPRPAARGSTREAQPPGKPAPRVASTASRPQASDPPAPRAHSQLVTSYPFR